MTSGVAQLIGLTLTLNTSLEFRVFTRPASFFDRERDLSTYLIQNCIGYIVQNVMF